MRGFFPHPGAAISNQASHVHGGFGNLTTPMID